MPERKPGILGYVLPFTPYPAIGSREPCNLCGSANARVVSTWDRRLKRLTTVICLDCGLLRADPMPTEEELEAYYATLYRLDYQLASKGPPRAHRAREGRRAEARAALLEPALKPGARVLDLGCGAGEFLAAVAARGCEAIGVEPGKTYAAWARRRPGVVVHECGWHEAEFPDRSFDVAAAHHVLEHLRRPVDALRRLASWLKNDGVLYVSVPDVSAGGNPAYERLHFAHVHGFAPPTLARAGWAAGLTPDRRFPQERTTIVFRKRCESDAAPDESSPAADILAAMRRADPIAYIFGFGFLRPMIRRNLAVLGDALRRAPR